MAEDPVELAARWRIQLRLPWQAISEITGASIVLAGDTVVVAVEIIRVVAWTSVLEEEDLGGALGCEVGTVLVRRSGGMRDRGNEQGRQRDTGPEDKQLSHISLSVRLDI